MKLLNKLKYLGTFVFVFLININLVMAAGECNFILGDVNNSTSFAYFLNQIFKLIKVGGPLLAVIMTIVDAVKAVTNQDKDTMNKFVNKTIKRVIYAVLLFVIPSLLDFVFRLVGIYGVCDIGLK